MSREGAGVEKLSCSVLCCVLEAEHGTRILGMDTERAYVRWSQASGSGRLFDVVRGTLWAMTTAKLAK